jgi:hypothetical protein
MKLLLEHYAWIRGLDVPKGTAPIADRATVLCVQNGTAELELSSLSSVS